MTKEQQIQNYMTKLNISYEEALQLWEDDQEDFIGEEGEKMTQKAKRESLAYWTKVSRKIDTIK